MAEIIVPTWGDFEEVVRSAQTRLIVCSPYYSTQGVGRVFDHLNHNSSLHFWTRLSPSDWVNGVSDPPQLLALLEILTQNGVEAELGIAQRLHAKAYAADRALVLVGSANLSVGGFDQNLELMARFRGEEAVAAVGTVEASCRPNLRPLTIQSLSEWVDSAEETINQVRRSIVQEPETLAPVQEKLDEILGYGRATSVGIPEPDLSDMRAFVAWLRQNHDLPGAEVLLHRHDNTDGQNLTGHFKQSFFAALRFLYERPDLRFQLSHVLDQLTRDDVFQLNRSPFIGEWLDYLDAHATDSGDDYHYSVLRNILPPSLGGTLQGGGGGISTVKRMLPLVARFLLEHGA